MKCEIIGGLPAGKYKQEYPPLLPEGLHYRSVDELRELCVKNFPQSAVRADLMAGFETVYERALALGIEGEAWVDGSFLTSKIEPKDVDFILIVDPEYRDKGTPEQVDFIEWLISNEQEPKNSLCCDTDVVIRYPENSPWYEHLTGSVLDHWQHEVYGKSVASGEPKGIVVVSLTKPKQSPPSAPGPANEGKEGDKR